MSPAPKEIQITLRIPGDLAQLLDQQAERTRTNRSWVIRDALHQYFSQNGNSTGNNEPTKG